MTERWMKVQAPNPWLGQDFETIWDEVVEAIKVGRDCIDPELEYDVSDIIDETYEYHDSANYTPSVGIKEFWEIVTRYNRPPY